MHTVHYPDASPGNSVGEGEKEFIAAALGINFSVEKHTAKIGTAEVMIIDNFFDSLRWDDTESQP